MNIISMFVCRNADRLIHIPFFKVDTRSCHDHRKAEQQLKKAIDEASCSVGIMIAFGEALKSTTFQNQIQKYIKLVADALPSSPYRVLKSYALMLATSELVSTNYVLCTNKDKY